MYLSQFFIKSSNEGQFQNQLLLSIPKLSLVARFAKQFTVALGGHKGFFEATDLQGMSK